MSDSRQQLRGSKVLVVGIGASGIAAARLCHRRGARVTVTDNRGAEALELSTLPGDVVRELGGHRPESFTGADLIVLSPGVPPIPELAAAREAGVTVIGEIELASRFVAAPLIAITGTNGKSTTTSLAAAMLEASGIDTFCGGNLGSPLAAAVSDGHPATTSPAGRVVVELSSFQLETVARFRAHVAVLLNLSEDHLDRYPSYEAYLAAKARIFERQRAGDFIVVNGEAAQRACRGLCQGSPAACLSFAPDVRPPATDAGGGWIEGGDLVLRLPDGRQERYPREALRLAGQHNALNALAALLAARLAGATEQGCRRALAGYTGLPHRMVLVGERAGVRYYDDSKATNVGSVVGSLSGFERPVVLIAGGKDKGGDYAPLLDVVGQVCRHVVLIGAAADRIAETLGRQTAAPLHRAATLERAVELASELAAAGDAVVLSPACSSFDMFSSFEHRGRAFAAAVEALGPGAAATRSRRR